MNHTERRQRLHQAEMDARMWRVNWSSWGVIASIAALAALPLFILMTV